MGLRKFLDFPVTGIGRYKAVTGSDSGCATLEAAKDWRLGGLRTMGGVR